MKRPTVYVNRSIDKAIKRYTAEGAPVGALGRVLIEWAVAIMDEAPTLSEDESRALLAIVRERPLRPRSATGEPRVSSVVGDLANALLAAGVSIPWEARCQLLRRLSRMHHMERLGLVLRLAWACEAMELLPGPGRRPLTFDEALALARLTEPSD